MTTLSIESKAFLKSCEEMFGSELIALFEGSNYLGTSDFAFLHPHQYILIVKNISKNSLDKVRVLLSDFPLHYVHLLGEKEVFQYPKHGLWQFHFRNPVVGENPFSTPLTTETMLAGIKHSIIQISHFIRKQFLGSENIWNTILSMRWSSWVLELLDFGIIRLWHYINTNHFPLDVDELLQCNQSNEMYEIINQLKFYKNKCNGEREIFFSDSEFPQEFLLYLNYAIEHYLNLIVNHPIFICKSKKIEKKNFQFHDDDIYGQFSRDLALTLGDELLFLQLSGSQARGEATLNSDIDTILITKNSNADVLRRIKSTLLQYPEFSSYVLSENGFFAYPSYRDFTFRYGCQSLSGQLVWEETISKTDVREAICHTLISITQEAKEYYICGGYPIRSIASIRWQAKMADFGCLRLFPLLSDEEYLETRTLVIEYFKENNSVQKVLKLLQDPDKWRKKCRQELLTGNRKTIDQNLLLIIEFAIDFLHQL